MGGAKEAAANAELSYSSAQDSARLCRFLLTDGRNRSCFLRPPSPASTPGGRARPGRRRNVTTEGGVPRDRDPSRTAVVFSRPFRRRCARFSSTEGRLNLLEFGPDTF